ncbi:MAG: hypothetical protein J0L56_18300 [Chitinophagales bacterium]|nr:hypothetical protein [Chitinophagales bacterium]
MIKTLRKRHLRVWIVLAIVLPIGILLSWLVIPNQAAVKLLQSHEQPLLPVIWKSKDLINYQVTIRTNQQHKQWQLEWVNKKILEVPSTVIYRVNGAADIAKNELIGRIETRGSYTFPLQWIAGKEQSFQFILYDFIHQQIIDSINFQL